MNSPLSHMSYHPVYGSWIGLRAVVVLDLDLSVANFLGAKRAENCICEGFPFLSFSPIECDKKAKKLLEELMMSTNYFDDHKQEDVWRSRFVGQCLHGGVRGSEGSGLRGWCGCRDWQSR